MTRHLADPAVGAVTAYIKEGSRPANWLNRFISYEYITAQAGARRGQNTIGVLACLAGGAQLLAENIEAIGGEIDTSSLAEDTFTTFATQLNGKRVVFDGNAVVWAEEPRTIDGLWKQRLRWARGNVQVTGHYRRNWLRRGRAGRLGGISFALIWFSVLLMPVLMVLSSAVPRPCSCSTARSRSTCSARCGRSTCSRTWRSCSPRSPSTRRPRGACGWRASCSRA